VRNVSATIFLQEVQTVVKVRLARLRIYGQVLLGILAILGSANGLAQGSAAADETTFATTQPKRTRSLRLVIDDVLLSALGGRVPPDFVVIPESKLNSQELVQDVGGGDSMLWIGNGNDIPEEMWIGTFRPDDVPVASVESEQSPAELEGLEFRPARMLSAYLKPVKVLPQHNIDEEPRADFLPILEGRDRFGQSIAYPAVLMHYYEPSTVRHRFAGSELFFFLFEKPAEALDTAGWAELLRRIAARFRAHLQIERVITDFTSYTLGERALIRATVSNLRSQATCTELHFYVEAPGETEFRKINTQRRCPDAESRSEGVADFIPSGQPGLWRIRVEAWQDRAHPEELANRGNPVLVDRRDIGVVALDGDVKTPDIVGLNGPSIRLEGKDGFWVGTNYYPSTSWWDWLWRDFRPLTAGHDFAAMRRAGYRLVRIWVDPVLDEQTLRALDAAIYLAAQAGIVLDVCVFTQWVNRIGFERPNGEHVSFDFRGPGNFNVYGISFLNLALQREYVQVLGRRWRGVGNLIYDLANETYINSPDQLQLDPQVATWEGIPQENGIIRNSLLFRRWAKEMSAAIRQAGGRQLIMAGDLFTLAGGADDYLGNRDSAIEPFHSYDQPEKTGLMLAYMDSACSGRPELLEEFGAAGGWNNEERFDGDAHYSLAAGAAGAVSYEWGISWLSRELSYAANELRDSRSQKPDPRWIPWEGLTDDKAFPLPARASGWFPGPSGFNWGSIYHATPFPAAAAVALGRVGLMGEGLGRAVRPEKVYLLVPVAMESRPTDIEKVISAIHRLWLDKVIFETLQEDCLSGLPNSVKVLIVPAALSAEGNNQLESLRAAGIAVFSGPDADWADAVSIARLPVTPSRGINFLTRRTVEGTLYSLAGAQPHPVVTLKTEGNATVALGLQQFAHVHERKSGVNYVEAAGNVVLNGAPVCNIEQGRAIIASDDDLDLAHSHRLRILAAAPTRITFSRPLHSVSILEAGVAHPLATLTPKASDARVLNIDQELSRYVLRVEMQ
jgi:hypothetical protein